MQHPSMMRIRQHFNAPDPIDPADTVRRELGKLSLASRIRHTEFSGDIESGLHKMMLIGKPSGCP